MVKWFGAFYRIKYGKTLHEMCHFTAWNDWDCRV